MRLLASLAIVIAAGLIAASPAMAGPTEDGNAGLDALNQGDYSKAVQLFTRAISSGKLPSADKEFAYSQRGEAYLKMGNSRAAALDFKRALAIKPDDQDAQAGLQEASASGGDAPPSGGSSSRPEQDAQAGMEALNGGDFGRAIAMFTRAINSGRLSSDDMELALLSRGKAYLGKGDGRRAVADLTQALHIKADDQEALDALGKAFAQVHAPGIIPGIDAAACAHNFSATGSWLAGKTYTGWAEYPTLATFDAFAGLYTAISSYTPMPGIAWQMTSANVEAGAMTANLKLTGDLARALTLEARIEPLGGGGSKITIRETVPGGMLTLDLKGTMCQMLGDAAKG